MNNLDKLKKWDDLYYNVGDPEVSDTEYDIFRAKVKKEFPNDPYFKKVGAKVTNKYEEIKLPFVLGGLDKVDVDTVEAWAKKAKGTIIASEKLDGNSVMCSWVNGKLSFAASRGDGRTGQNILRKAGYFVPKITTNTKVTLRGEVLLEGNLYQELGFKNRRNGVTGLLRRDEVAPTDLAMLSVRFYEVIEPTIEHEVSRLAFIKSLGLNCVKYITVPNTNIPEKLAEWLVQLKEEATYDIDGLVLTVNDSKHENVEYPKNKIKFKVNELAKTCKVLGVEWNVTRMGTLAPVILIEPTEIMGVTVSRCSGFNYANILANQIGVGASIGVVRSGDVIPYVTEVFKPAKTLSIPTKCPSCDMLLRKTDVHLICDNYNCPQKKKFIVAHFFEKMGADNISERTIEMLGVASVQAMYNLTVKDMEKLQGFGKKKAELIYNEIQKTLTTKPEKLLSAFGMPLIGDTLSRTLCSRFSFDELFTIKDASVLGLGPITSQSLIDSIGSNKQLYKFLKGQGLKFIKEDASLKTLKGMEFALTGAGELKRREYEQMVEEKGGIIKGVNKNTAYLVTDNVNSGSDKLKKAEKLGTKIITYAQFMDLLR